MFQCGSETETTMINVIFSLYTVPSTHLRETKISEETKEKIIKQETIKYQN